MESKLKSPLPFGKYSSVLARIPAKDSLGVTYSELKKTDMNASSTFPSKDEFFGVIETLNALGALRITINQRDFSSSKIAYVSEGAKDFVVSLLLCAESGVIATDSWGHKFNPSVDPVWGLLQEMERRRRDHLQNKDRPVVRSEEVAVILIKGQIKRLGKAKDVFLCKYDQDSGYYNFIGGKVRYEEDLIKTVKRKLHDELGIPSDSDKYQIETINLIGDEIVTQKISHESGVYTEYHFHLFQAKNITARPDQYDQKNKWFEMDEILSGKSNKGEKIMAHPEIINALRSKLNTTYYPNGIADLEYSVKNITEFNVTAIEEQWWNKISASYGSLLTFIATLLTVVTGLVGLIVSILKLLGIVK